MTAVEPDARAADPRWQRSRARLHDAVLELARDRPVDRITGSALATAAGVHRSTIYEHGCDTSDILRGALRAELDEIRQRLIEPATADTILRATAESADEVFAHVDRHGAIYARELDRGSAGLSTMLAEHFAHSVRLLIAHGAVTPPAVPDDDREAVAETVAASIVAAKLSVPR